MEFQDLRSKVLNAILCCAPRPQVIPFLVLAVGVDNMFILAHALERRPPNTLPGAASGSVETLPERLGAALAAAGPSVTLAAIAEALAFALGSLSGMPAVRNFSLAAALAVLLDYLLQARLRARTSRPALLVKSCTGLVLGGLAGAPAVQLLAAAALQRFGVWDLH